MHENEVVTWFGLQFNIQTLEMTWLTMAVVIFIAFLATRNLKLVPSGCQNFLEMIIVWLDDQIDASIGARGRLVAPLLISLFLFLLIANWVGLVPSLSSPTKDLNTTLGLALMVIVMLHFFGLYYKGAGYIKHFFQPIAPFVIINLIEEIAKPITLAFRLFGNILAGEMLIHILAELLPAWMPIPGVVWLGFSMFIGVIQAFIFTMLSMSYLASVMSSDEKH